MVSVLVVGDILKLSPVNGAAMFDNKSITNKLGCMTSVNIWQDCVVYDVTIKMCQKKKQAFSSILDEVRHGCTSQSTLQALKETVITTSTAMRVDSDILTQIF